MVYRFLPLFDHSEWRTSQHRMLPIKHHPHLIFDTKCDFLFLEDLQTDPSPSEYTVQFQIDFLNINHQVIALFRALLNLVFTLILQIEIEVDAFDAYSAQVHLSCVPPDGFLGLIVPLSFEQLHGQVLQIALQPLDKISLKFILDALNALHGSHILHRLVDTDMRSRNSLRSLLDVADKGHHPQQHVAVSH